jgi:serine/threonine protein kinase
LYRKFLISVISKTLGALPQRFSSLVPKYASDVKFNEYNKRFSLENRLLKVRKEIVCIISYCLVYYPESRYDVFQLLKHDYFTSAGWDQKFNSDLKHLSGTEEIRVRKNQNNQILEKLNNSSLGCSLNDNNSRKLNSKNQLKLPSIVSASRSICTLVPKPNKKMFVSKQNKNEPILSENVFNSSKLTGSIYFKTPDRSREKVPMKIAEELINHPALLRSRGI